LIWARAEKITKAKRKKNTHTHTKFQNLCHSTHCNYNILSFPWYNLSVYVTVTLSTILFSHHIGDVLMSQDYLKSALPSQIMSERGSNLVVINPGMQKIQFCSLPIYHILPKINIKHLNILTLLILYPLLLRFCKC